MFMTLWLYGLEIRLHAYMYVCLYVCDISKFVLHSTYIIISNSVAETKMTAYKICKFVHRGYYWWW